NELVVDSILADDAVEFFEREIEEVFLLAQDTGGHEAFGFLKQGLLVDELAADLSVLWIFAVTDEGTDAIGHPLGFFSFPLSIGEDPKLRQHVLLFLPREPTSMFESPPALARAAIPDVAEDQGQQRTWLFAPARPGDVDFADAAHAVLLEPGA